MVISISTIALAVVASFSGLNKADELATKAAAAAKSASQSSNNTNQDGVVTALSTPGLWVTGDSVILGIRNVLAQYQKIELINARVGRQIGELIQVAKTDQQYVSKSPVVLNMGNNNKLSEGDVVTLMEIVKNQPKIVVVNTAVPRPWKDSNNELIAKVVSRYASTTIIDWNRISTNHPEYFAEDGVHLNPPGVNAYVSAILEVLDKQP